MVGGGRGKLITAVRWIRQGWRARDGLRFDCQECIEDDQQEARGCPLSIGRGPCPAASDVVHVEMQPARGSDGKPAGEVEVDGTASYRCPHGLAIQAKPLIDTLTYLHDFGPPAGTDWLDLPRYVLKAYSTSRWGLFG